MTATVIKGAIRLQIMKKGSCCLVLVFILVVTGCAIFISDVHSHSQKRIEDLKKEVTTAVICPTHPMACSFFPLAFSAL